MSTRALAETYDPAAVLAERRRKAALIKPGPGFVEKGSPRVNPHARFHSLDGTRKLCPKYRKYQKTELWDSNPDEQLPPAYTPKERQMYAGKIARKRAGPAGLRPAPTKAEAEALARQERARAAGTAGEKSTAGEKGEKGKAGEKPAWYEAGIVEETEEEGPADFWLASGKPKKPPPSPPRRPPATTASWRHAWWWLAQVVLPVLVSLSVWWVFVRRRGDDDWDE